jgi:dihydroneopterin aldolase
MAIPKATPRFSDETIHIVNLRVNCIIGVNPRERVVGQPLVINASFPGSFAAAARGDDLTRTVNYSEVARAIRAFARAGRYRLLETLARRLGAHLCARFGLAGVALHILKPRAIPGAGGAAVSLTVKAGKP